MKQAHGLSICLVIAILALAVPVIGQNSNGNEGCNFCFRGKPKGKCCSFLIFEAGFFYYGIAESGIRRGTDDLLFTADLGLMFNNKGSSALGGSFHISAYNNIKSFGFGPRYRKWLGKGVALDLSPRLLIAGTSAGSYPGFAFSAALAVHEWFSIHAYLDIVTYERQNYLGPSNFETVKETKTALYLGASGRGWIALITSTIIIMVAVDLSN
ncbi:MAG: hypothetical protein IIA17_11105 [candidate division Zixibacteria bacterium]|nr:hypothetical protein [candidate division Zixibacteria bacterium]